jgi:bacterioferritin-associated ferredoxin
MYVCICHNVTEKDIKRAVKDGAESMACLQEKLAVSTSCGQCHDRARECLASYSSDGFALAALPVIS